MGPGVGRHTRDLWPSHEKRPHSGQRLRCEAVRLLLLKLLGGLLDESHAMQSSTISMYETSSRLLELMLCLKPLRVAHMADTSQHSISLKG